MLPHEKEDSGAHMIKPALTIEMERKLKDSISYCSGHIHTNTLLGLNFGDFIRNFSTYPDVNDLLIASDI